MLFAQATVVGRQWPLPISVRTAMCRGQSDVPTYIQHAFWIDPLMDHGWMDHGLFSRAKKYSKGFNPWRDLARLILGFVDERGSATERIGGWMHGSMWMEDG